MEVAARFCKEVTYELNSKEYFEIGFKNDYGGYELRNLYFKAGGSPKDISTLNDWLKKAMVFEGFINFLSFMTIHKEEQETRSHFVILNSAFFF